MQYVGKKSRPRLHANIPEVLAPQHCDGDAVASPDAGHRGSCDDVLVFFFFFKVFFKKTHKR